MATVGALGVVLPQEVTDSITAAATEPLPGSNTPTPQVQASAIPGGVSAMPIDASTYLQITIPPNPTFPNPSGGVQVTINARILGNDGTLTYCSWPQVFNVNAGLTYASDLAPGYLLSVAVTCVTPNIPDGVLYAVVGLIHQAQTGIPLDTLLVASYVNSNQPAGWPSGILRTVSDGNGATFQLAPANPPAGFAYTYTVLDQQLELVAVYFNLTTSAAVVNRTAYVQVHAPGGGPQFAGLCPNTQAASLTVTYSMGAGLPTLGAAGALYQQVTLLDNILLSAGSVLVVNAGSLQAGDQFTGIQIFGRAWL